MNTKTLHLIWIFLGMGCGEKDSPAPIFQTTSSSSNSSDENNQSNNQEEEDEDTGDQTNINVDGSITDDSPIIENLYAYFYVDSDGVDIIETHVVFSDPQNDVENGQMFFEYSSDATSGSLGMEIGGAYVIYEAGDEGYELTHYLYDIDNTAVYEISVQLQDIAGNVSEKMSTNVNPVDDEE